MHKYLPNLYAFMDQYDHKIFKNNITNLGIIYRNYHSSDREKDLFKISKACKKKRYKLFVANSIKLALKVKADGLYRFMCDADLAMPIEGLQLFLNEMSLGQKQRVIIARTLYQDKSVYIFDEYLSAVDKKQSDIILALEKDIELKDNIILVLKNK